MKHIKLQTVPAAILALVTATLGLLAAFGVDLSPEQIAAIGTTVAAALRVVAVR